MTHCGLLNASRPQSVTLWPRPSAWPTSAHHIPPLEEKDSKKICHRACLLWRVVTAPMRKLSLPPPVKCTRIDVMGVLWFIGFIATFWIISSIFNYFERKAQKKALLLFEKAHPNLFAEIDAEIENLSANISCEDYRESVLHALQDTNCYFHLRKHPNYGDCFCCEHGRLVLRQNFQNNSFFVGCTSYFPLERVSHGHKYTLKSCRFTFPI